MPVIHRQNGYVFFFYSQDRLEPMHLHVRKGDAVAKYWLEPVEFAKNSGFRPHQLREIREIVEEHRETFIEEWERYFRG